jgi:putative methyltransferase
MLISLVQPNFQQGPKEFNAHYLPYSVGVLWSYVNQFEKIKNSYILDQIIWQRSDLEATALKLVSNDVVAFSTYVWNKNYNYALAKRLKELNPKCLMIFGGPEIPVTKRDIFRRFPFMDIVVKGEGEITLRTVLECLVDQGSFDLVGGLVLNKEGVAVDTGPAERISILDDIPSPYLTGVFDKIIAETTGVQWNATLETNRGCPYQCTFCDWGSLTYNKVKQFNLDRVFAELDWIARNKCGFVTITDANFGMFVERDDAIANKMLELQDQYGYPESLSITWAKNQKPEVFAIVSKLIKSPRFNSGLTVSVQSMDEGVLEHIKRKNLDQHKISEIFAMCEKHNVPVYTEIILGLPGETASSWKEGVWKLFRAGNHTGLNILHAQLLENAEMNLLQRKLFGITSVNVYDYMSGSYNNNYLRECVEIVTSTKDMPYDQMINSQLFNCFINTFHINGLTTFISRFLHRAYGIDYSTFYDKFYAFLESEPWFMEETVSLRALYNKWMTTGMIDHPGVGNIEIHGWNVNHLTTIGLHAKNEYDHVFGLIERFITETFDLSPNMITQLIRFQKRYVINYEKIREYPYRESFDYDFQGYLQSGTELHTPVEYDFTFFEEADISLDRFLESIYFGRKRNFGKAIITKCL